VPRASNGIFLPAEAPHLFDAMPPRSKLAVAWSMTLAPVVLFIPAFMLAGMGPCSFSHPLVLVAALLLFIVLEVLSLPNFVTSARASGRAIVPMIGIGFALILLAVNAIVEYYVVAEYWAESQFTRLW
jgi:hypothetical protein